MSWFVRAAVIRNEFLRLVATGAVRTAFPLVRATLGLQIASHAVRQRRLSRRYGLGPDVAITVWCQETQNRIDRCALSYPATPVALTSGSTSLPKRIPYSRHRLRAIRQASFETVVQAAHVLNIGRPSLFVLTTMHRDKSLSSLLLDIGKEPTLFSALIMPSQCIWKPSILRLVDQYGATAVRLWLMVLSSPTVIYSTNPSTLAVFLNDVIENWDASTQLIRDHANNPSHIDPNATRAIISILTKGWAERLSQIAKLRLPTALDTMVPSIRCYCCWDGGYVTDFLRMIRERLSPQKIGYVPMYSMSTECIQTKTYYVGKEPSYLPIAAGVLYEFLNEGDPDDVSHLLRPNQLKVGKAYSMVVSDAYGLRRYQTEDVFLCVGMVSGLPDLRFLRRRGLSYSFTGEKLTGQQVEEATQRTISAFPELSATSFQTMLIPRSSGSQLPTALPHYVLTIAYAGTRRPAANSAFVARTFDEHLAAINPEFAVKRASGRLGETRGLFVAYDCLATAMMKPSNSSLRDWDAQFKLLPLARQSWDELGLPPLENWQ